MSDREPLHTSDLTDRTRGAIRAEDEPLSRDQQQDPGADWDNENAARGGGGGSGDRPHQQPVESELPNSSASELAHGEAGMPLLPSEQTSQFEQRWQQIQISFVDQPQQAVEQADTLVAELMRQLAASFSETRTQLEEQWASSGEASTEDLRIALTRYRSFFQRPLSA